MRLAQMLVVVMACGGSAAALVACSTPPSGSPSSSDGPAPHIAWKDMDKAQRLRHMKTVVFPEMRSEFQHFDAEGFKDFACVTCHGQGAKDKTFKMPNPELPKLPGDEAGFRQLAAEEPEIVKFMSDTVVPTMARLLDEKPYDPATQQGFGCFRCHTQK